TRIRGEQSDEMLTARMACLDRARAEARALVGAWAGASAATLSNAVTSASSLTDLADCASARGLLGMQQPPPAERPGVEALRRQLAEAKSLRAAGQVARAFELE